MSSIPSATFIKVGDTFGLEDINGQEAYTVFDMNKDELVCGYTKDASNTFRPLADEFRRVKLYHCTLRAFLTQGSKFTAENVIRDKQLIYVQRNVALSKRLIDSHLRAAQNDIQAAGTTAVSVPVQGEGDFKMRAFCHLALLPDYHYAEQAHFERDGLVCFAFDDLPVIAEGFSKHMSEAWEQMEDPFFSYLKMPLGKPATAAAAAEVESESPKDTAKRACSCIEKHWAANHKDALIHFRLNMRIKQVLLSDLLQSLLYASWRSCPIALKVFYDCYCQQV